MPSAHPPSALSHSSHDLPPNPISKPFSISFGSTKLEPPKTSNTVSPSTKPNNPRKRPHSSLNDDSDSDPQDRPERFPQLVSTFDHSAGGAISVNGTEKANPPLVIQGLKNRDWREETKRKRGKNLLPAEVQAQRAGQENRLHDGQQGQVERDEVGKASGLTFVQKDDGGDVNMMDGLVGTQVEHPRPKTVDEEALEALMGDGGTKSTLVVPAVTAEVEDGFRNGRAGLNEEDTFRSDVSSRPDSASLDDYARVPVEEFGMGMLRGMGWKEGGVVGKRKDQVSRTRVVERRPALLGIGAKEVPGGVGDELGAWGNATKGKRKVEKMYNPVLLKNSKTGEMMTEEELQAKKEEQKEAEKEWRARRDRNLAIDEEKKSERKRRDRERGCEDGSSRARREERSEHRHSSSQADRSHSPHRRHGSSKRERSRSRERRRHSRRRDYDEGDTRNEDRRRREIHNGRKGRQ
ncbi:MAG: hypothetical protein L6R40_001941 [Gallowayella cf. fulva]|nr:MAG: hypothetical protein L6R40_001941 [Xanthomendoza cf. fulva]